MSENEGEGRVIRLRLRRPEAEKMVEDLAHAPRDFDALFPKQYYAYQMKLAGHDWPHIAAKLGYNTAWAAESAVRRWLYKTNEKQSKQWAVTKEKMHADAVAAECDRLDMLQAAYWEDAVKGDLPSANYVLRVIQQRAKLLGLEATTTAQVTTQLNTLVVGGSESEYVAALVKARDRLGPALGPKIIEGSNDDQGVMD